MQSSYISRFNLFLRSGLAPPTQTQRLLLKSSALSSNTSMAAATSARFVLGAHHLTSLATHNGPSGDTSLESCRKARMSLKSREPSNGNQAFGYLFFDSVKRGCSSNNPFILPGSKGFRRSASSSYVTGSAPAPGTANEEQVQTSSASSDQKVLGDKALKLLSGSCYLPHPDKEETGGEDAHFIEEQAIGVADGVGGWAEMGVDAGLFARELILHSVTAIRDEPKGSIDPARVLEKANSCTKAIGSSTACIIVLTDQGLHTVNLGDSGFVVVRDGHTVFQSPVQQHDFNFPYQLGCDGDLPSSGQVFTIPVAPGDVIVAGTDGLFDNLYNNEITAVVVNAVRAGLEPQVAAQKIAALARQRALKEKGKSPFSTAAKEAGYSFPGGKLDDITVVVSYITNGSNTSGKTKKQEKTASNTAVLSQL